MITSTQNYDWFMFGTTAPKRDIVSETFGKYASNVSLTEALLEEHAAEHCVESDEFCRCVARDSTGSEIDVPSIDNVTCYFCGKPRRSRKPLGGYHAKR